MKFKYWALTKLAVLFFKIEKWKHKRDKIKALKHAKRLENKTVKVSQLQEVFNWLSAEDTAIMENQSKLMNKLNEISQRIDSLEDGLYSFKEVTKEAVTTIEMKGEKSKKHKAK